MNIRLDIQAAVNEEIIAITERIRAVEENIAAATQVLFAAHAVGLVLSRAGHAVDLEPRLRPDGPEVTEQTIKDLWSQRRNLIAQKQTLLDFLNKGGDNELQAQLRDLNERCQVLFAGGEPG